MPRKFPATRTHPRTRSAAEGTWYDLFSRGARDWLRHNEKVRDAVRYRLNEFIEAPDALTRAGRRTLLVPIRLLEHARFRLREPTSVSGVGQGDGDPGQVLHPALPGSTGASADRSGGQGEGTIEFVVELDVDDILDWLWEEMRLPDLKPKPGGTLDDVELAPEGWDRHGARSRLDRRRTMKEAVRRRAVQQHPVPFVDEDLRFRTLMPRRTRATNAAIVFAIDVSGSMGQTERRLAKAFFYFALQGLRRRYPKVETAFLAHAALAWEFSEAEFFLISGTGGTVASSVFHLARDVIQRRYNPAQYNCYLLYASDGENAAADHDAATEALRELMPMVSFAGYLEVRTSVLSLAETEMHGIVGAVQREGGPVGTVKARTSDDVWEALRRFFRDQEQQEGAA